MRLWIVDSGVLSKSTAETVVVSDVDMSSLIAIVDISGSVTNVLDCREVKVTSAAELELSNSVVTVKLKFSIRNNGDVV